MKWKLPLQTLNSYHLIHNLNYLITMSHHKRFLYRCNQVEGTTLLELMVGMAITTVVIGLAMQALVRTQSSFSTDQKKVENGQKMLSVLEIVGR